VRMTGLDHVFLNVGSKPVLWPENRTQPRPRMRGNAVDDVNELMIDRGRVTDDADALTVETGGREQSL
jgi:hypothetical protein